MAKLVKFLLFDTTLLLAVISSWLVVSGHMDWYVHQLGFCGVYTHNIIHRAFLFLPATVLIIRVANLFTTLLIVVALFPVDNGVLVLSALSFLLHSDQKVILIPILIYLLSHTTYDTSLITCSDTSNPVEPNTTSIVIIPVTTPYPTEPSTTVITYEPTTVTLAPSSTLTTTEPTTTTLAQCEPIVCASAETPPLELITSILCTANCSTPTGPVVSVDDWVSRECGTIQCGPVPSFGQFDHDVLGFDNYKCAVWVLAEPNFFKRCTDYGLDSTHLTTSSSTSPVEPTIPTVITGN